jgi:hypothetical protein
MKISNSKKQLAKIINENGGWRDGFSFAAQDKDGDVFAFDEKPSMGVSREVWMPTGSADLLCSCTTIRGWHQTILSRDEYFYLYQEQGLEDSLNVDMPEAEPSIEQLASDYRNAKDYAERKQQEADAAKVDAEAKLAAYVAAAGSAVGLVLSVGVPEPELVITDWRKLQAGDVIKCVGDDWSTDFEGKEAVVSDVEDPDYDGTWRISVDIDGEGDWGRDFKFIRRPTRETNNA